MDNALGGFATFLEHDRELLLFRFNVLSPVLGEDVIQNVFLQQDSNSAYTSCSLQIHLYYEHTFKDRKNSVCISPNSLWGE